MRFVLQMSIAVWTAIGISLIPATATPVDDPKLKRLQLMHRVTVSQYWVATYIWDFCMFLIPAGLIILTLYLFGLEIVGA